MAAQEAEVHSTQQLTSLEDYQFTGDTYTLERKRAFILNYREQGSIYHAARLTPVSRKTVYNWIEADPQFAEAVADSKEDCLDDLETSVFRRAFSDSILAMFYLKAHRHKFRDKVTIDVEVVKNEIEERMNQLNLRSLPPAMMGAQFIETETINSLQFPSQPEQIQKELSESESSESSAE